MLSAAPFLGQDGPPALPDRSTCGSITCFPLMYVSAPLHGSRVTTTAEETGRDQGPGSSGGSPHLWG